MKKLAESRALLPIYFALTYFALLWINHGTLDVASAAQQGWTGVLFIVNAFASYNFMYLLPAMLLTWLAGRAPVLRLLRLQQRREGVVLTVAVLATALTTLFFFVNARLYELYGMFVNGFVINLVTTPGGIESLGGSNASNAGFALIGVGFFVVHGLAAFVLNKLLQQRDIAFGRGFARALVAVFLLSTVGDRVSYATANAFGHPEYMVLTQGIPYYVSMTARTVFKKLGFSVAKETKGVSLRNDMHYPAHPLDIKKPAKPYNIVWLVSESWRADALDPEVMPATWQFAAQAQNFKLHYSGGNGTRVGVFTMMTGISGNYWEPFLQAHRGAPLIDVLQQQGYQMSLYSSAHFSYPEFDQTVFSQVPKAQLHEVAGSGQGWQKDRQNVSDLLDFIDKRDPSRPFFTWMFFESPHARYYFPPESVIRTPYRDDINYATLSKEELRQQIGPIKNRYINAVHHLDSQFARIFDYLKSHQLLDNTIVVLLGDHGEEFMENGYWGHNSTFSDPQTRTPLVLWIPGQAPAVHEGLSSHLDIVPTLMPLLGVQNPTEDYALGQNLLSGKPQDYVLLSDWSHIGFRNQAVKISLPLNVQGGVGRKVTGPDDQPMTDEQASRAFAEQQSNLVAVMQALGRFNRQPKK